MKVQIEVDIFDDPENCGKQFYVCDYYILKQAYCKLFDTQLESDDSKKGFEQYIKCTECKAAYAKTKNTLR